MFQIHTSRMTLVDDVNLENLKKKIERICDDIKAICTEAITCF